MEPLFGHPALNDSTWAFRDYCSAAKSLDFFAKSWSGVCFKADVNVYY